MRLGGVVLIAAAVALAVALFGFDRRDPSLNQATWPSCRTIRSAAPGAYVADLLYQLFGLAAWLPVLVGLSWGVRLALSRRLAGMAVRACRCAPGTGRLLAVLPPLPAPGLPLQAGLGGAVGDLQWRWLEPLGENGFAAAIWWPACCSRSRRSACAGAKGSGRRRQGRHGLAVGRAPPADAGRRAAAAGDASSATAGADSAGAAAAARRAAARARARGRSTPPCAARGASWS